MEKKKIPLKTRIIIALVFGGIFLISGFFVSFNNPYGNTTQEIQQVEDAIGKEFADIGKVTHEFDEKSGKTFELVCLGPTWEKIQEITRPLVYENERIAKERALLRFNENPIPSYSFDNDLWTERFDGSKQDWRIQSFISRILKSTGKGFAFFFVSIIIVYLILTVVPWLW